ncbi:hypothetical protein D3C78_1754310 [compost metagenome]
MTAIWRATDDIQQAFAANVHFCDTQLVSIWVLAALNDFSHNHTVKCAGNRLNAIHFQTGHGDLVRKRFAVKSRVYPFA